MIQVGDMVRLLDSGCDCPTCIEAMSGFHKVLVSTKDDIYLDMKYGRRRMEANWDYEVMSDIQENE